LAGARLMRGAIRIGLYFSSPFWLSGVTVKLTERLFFSALCR
jgi:hypothetical protein